MKSYDWHYVGIPLYHVYYGVLKTTAISLHINFTALTLVISTHVRTERKITEAMDFPKNTTICLLLYRKSV